MQTSMNARLVGMLAILKPAVQTLRAHIHVNVTRATLETDVLVQVRRCSFV